MHTVLLVIFIVAVVAWAASMLGAQLGRLAAWCPWVAVVVLGIEVFAGSRVGG